ncbi:MAG: hypothetical protein ACPL4I_10800 [Bacteroidota bacterium]
MSRKVAVGIAWRHVTSYNNIARDICAVNEWDCQFVYPPFAPFSIAMPHPVDVFFGSVYDVVHSNAKARLYYITVEGELTEGYTDVRLKRVCSQSYCITVTKWGKEVFEKYGVPVADYIHHALPIPVPAGEPRAERELDVVYQNDMYRLLSIPAGFVDRKGWDMWPRIVREFPNSRGYTKSPYGYGLPNVAVYSSASIDELYGRLESARVFANLSLGEGFGMNVLMALAVGTNAVMFSHPVLNEVYGGIDGAHIVETAGEVDCRMPTDVLIKIKCVKPNIDAYVAKVREVLNSWRTADWQTVRQKYDPYRLYKKFVEFLPVNNS